MRGSRASGLRWLGERRIGIIFLALATCALASSCSSPPVKISGGVNPKATETSLAKPATATAPATTPKANPTTQEACGDIAGEVRSLSYPGKVINGPVKLEIYLPPCYSSSDERYPSLYLLHGYPQDEQHWKNLGMIDLVEENILAGEWPPVLLIMPSQPDPLFTKTDGGPGSYEQELIDGLLPYIDANFRTIAQPQSRVLAGISRGGVWALEIGLRNAELFDTVVALSPSLSVNHPRPAYDPFSIVSGNDPLPAWIFISGGEGEPSFLKQIESFVQRLTDERIEHTFLLTDYNHSDESWERILPEVIQFIQQSWE